MPIRTACTHVAIRKHRRRQGQEMANQERLAIDLLPQVAETNTPWLLDVTGERLL